MTLKSQLAFCQQQLNRCIEDDNPYDAIHWYKEIAKIERELKKQEDKKITES